MASGAEVLTSSAIYDWTHARRRRVRRKSMPFGIYSRTFRTLRMMCEPVERFDDRASVAVALARAYWVRLWVQ
jgi:hypothetical protein